LKNKKIIYFKKNAKYFMNKMSSKTLEITPVQQTSTPISVPNSQPTSELQPPPTLNPVPVPQPSPIIITILVPTVIGGTSIMVTSTSFTTTTATTLPLPLPLPQNNNNDKLGILLGSVFGILFLLLLLLLILFFSKKKKRNITPLPSFITPTRSDTILNSDPNIFQIPVYPYPYQDPNINEEVAYVLNDGYGRDISYNNYGEPMYAILN
jgi:hypothetical protein